MNYTSGLTKFFIIFGDPVGASESPCARDEYWSYLPKVFNMLVKDEPKILIVNYLLSVERDRMGTPNPNRSNVEHVVGILYQYKKKIFSEE